MEFEPPEKDPITIAEPRAVLNGRLANLYFRPENSPRDPDQSVSISGSVKFGVVEIPNMTSGYVYEIGIRRALLCIETINCQFDCNSIVEVISQPGSYSEDFSGGQSVQGKMAAKAKGGVVASTMRFGASASAEFEAAGSAATQSTIKRKGKPQIRQIFWTAGGCQFGDRETGNPLDRDGLFEGEFLKGEWGRLVPNPDKFEYSATFRLVVSPRGLSVTRKGNPPPAPKQSRWGRIFKRRAASQPKPSDSAFDALRQSVAAWMLEENIKLASDLDELVLVQSDVSVDLSGFKQKGAENSNVLKALPAPQVTIIVDQNATTMKSDK